MGTNVIVTGAAGFIGRNLVAELNRRGENDIILVDELGSNEKWKNLRGLEFEDFMDIDDFRDHVEADELPDVKTVFHLGACSSTTETDADYLADNNYRYSRLLCEWSLQHGARFVYASSAATYGDGSEGYEDNLRNLHTLKPLNMYGYSKHMFDMWARKNNLFTLIAGLKYFNVYGPCEDHKDDMRSVVHKAFGQIREKGSVKLFKSHRPDYKDGEQLRDFVYVKDAVDVTLYFGENRSKSGLFNCGTGQARCWNDLVKAVFSAMNLEPNIEYIDMPEHLREKYQYYTQATVENLREAGYSKEFTSLEDGIRDYVQSYLIPNGNNE